MRGLALKEFFVFLCVCGLIAVVSCRCQGQEESVFGLKLPVSKSYGLPSVASYQAYPQIPVVVVNQDCTGSL